MKQSCRIVTMVRTMFSLIRTNSVIQTEDQIGLHSAVRISEDVLYQTSHKI